MCSALIRVLSASVAPALRRKLHMDAQLQLGKNTL